MYAMENWDLLVIIGIYSSLNACNSYEMAIGILNSLSIRASNHTPTDFYQSEKFQTKFRNSTLPHLAL
jgi:hypothetical protein